MRRAPSFEYYDSSKTGQTSQKVISLPLITFMTRTKACINISAEINKEKLTGSFVCHSFVYNCLEAMMFNTHRLIRIKQCYEGLQVLGILKAIKQIGWTNI